MWDDARRQAQAALLRERSKPWEKATGPKTAEGKARSAGNAYKGGQRVKLREAQRALRALKAAIKERSND